MSTYLIIRLIAQQVRCGQPLRGVPMARQQLTEAVGIPQPLNRIAGALGRPGDDLRVEGPC